MLKTEKSVSFFPAKLKRAVLVAGLTFYMVTETVLELSQRNLDEKETAVTLIIYDQNTREHEVVFINQQGVINHFTLDKDKVAWEVNDRSVLVTQETAPDPSGKTSLEYAVADAFTGKIEPVSGSVLAGNYADFRLQEKQIVSHRFDQAPDGWLNTYLDIPKTGETIHHRFPPTEQMQRFLSGRVNHYFKMNSNGSEIIRSIQNDNNEWLFVAQNARHPNESRTLFLNTDEYVHTRLTLDAAGLMFISFVHIDENGRPEFLQTVWDSKNGPINQTSADLICLQIDPDTLVFDGQLTVDGNIILIANRNGHYIAYLVGYTDESDRMSVYEFELPGLVTGILQEDSISAEPVLQVIEGDSVSFWQVSSETGLKKLPLTYELEPTELVVDSNIANLEDLEESNLNYELGILATIWFVLKSKLWAQIKLG